MEGNMAVAVNGAEGNKGIGVEQSSPSLFSSRCHTIPSPEVEFPLGKTPLLDLDKV
jgi:hypothetical protein